MRIEEIGRALRAEPFRRFVLRTADGTAYEVPHPEFAAVHPRSERTVVVFGESGETSVLDPMLITALDFRDGRSRAAG